jgi:hypothetical protein
MRRLTTVFLIVAALSVVVRVFTPERLEEFSRVGFELGKIAHPISRALSKW